jgi:hypothetical protein
LIKNERFANLDKVVIRIKRIDGQILLFMNSNYDFEFDNDLNFDNIFSIDDKKYLNIYFETNSMQKLNTIHYKCNESRNDRTLFTDYYSNDCEDDCLLNAIEKFYGCLPLNSYLVVGFEKDLKTFKHKLCSIEEVDYRRMNTSFQNEYNTMYNEKESPKILQNSMLSIL